MKPVRPLYAILYAFAATAAMIAGAVRDWAEVKFREGPDDE